MGNRFTAAGRLSVLLAAAVLTGCQAYLPRDETPVLPGAFAVDVPRGPSSQRVGRDGYPLIGAYPSAATQQANQRTIDETKARYANVEGRASASPENYQRSLEELRSLSAGQRAPAASTASADELRELIEERRRRASGQ